MKNKKLSLTLGIMLCALTVLFTVIYMALFGEETAKENYPIPTDAGDSYAEKAILFACEKGYMTTETVGGAAYFYPQKEVTRGELATVLTAYLGYSEENAPKTPLGFADESTLDEEALPAVKLMLAGGHMMLRADYTFGADAGITREEAAQIFGALIDKEISAGKSEKFSDFSEVGDYFLTDATRTVDFEIMIGYEDGTFRPKNILTREELALILYRLAHNEYIS